MDQYFMLNHIRDDETKLHVGGLYLDQERWKWWQWHKKCYARPITWQVFSKSLCERFEWESNFLGHLTKLRKIGTIHNYITAFEKLAFHTRGLVDEFYLECFIRGLKDVIQAHVGMHHPPTCLAPFIMAREVEHALVAQSPRPNFMAKGCPTQALGTTQTLKVQKVSPTEMAESRKQGLCYYCDDKYSPGHKCKEPKFFQIDATNHSSSKETPSFEGPKEEYEDN